MTGDTIPPTGERPVADSSQAQILRSTSIIGASSAVSMLLGILRGKVVAMVLGPAGLGLIGLLNNLMSTAANVAALGIGTSGIRHIADAAARGEAEEIARASRSLMLGMALLAVLGGGIMWLLRDVIATHVLGNPALAPTVGWLAVGTALLVAAGSQGALLNGLRRTGDLARVAIGAALLGSALGIGVIVVWGERGLVAYVLAAPLALFLVGHWYVTRLARAKGVRLSAYDCVRQCAGLARLGMSFMFAGLVFGGGLLIIRARLQAVLGPAALGMFEAAWAISMTYIGAVMGAMGTDFYPRLTALIDRPQDAAALVNDQTRIALWLCGPVCVLVIGFAPWVLSLLFSSEFVAAATVLRWQVLGDILKILSWPLGFVLLAAGDGRRFVAGEAIAVSLFAAVTWFALPRIGLPAAGLGFFVMYLVYLPLVHRWARRRINFRWDNGVRRDAAMLVVGAAGTALAATVSPGLGAAVGGVVAVGLGGAALWHLAHLAPREGAIGRLAAFVSHPAHGDRRDG